MPLRGGARSPWGKLHLLRPTQALLGEISAHREQVGKPCLCIQPVSQQGAFCLASFSFSSLPQALQQQPLLTSLKVRPPLPGSPCKGQGIQSNSTQQQMYLIKCTYFPDQFSGNTVIQTEKTVFLHELDEHFYLKDRTLMRKNSCRY